MNERMTEKAKRTHERALREALALGHNYIGVEHILLALLWHKDTVAYEMLSSSGVSYDGMRAAMIERFSRRVRAELLTEERVREIVGEMISAQNRAVGEMLSREMQKQDAADA